MASTEKYECAGYLMLREKYQWINESIHRSACHGEADWEVEGKHYCLMHSPDKRKTVAFNKVLKERLAAKNYNFRGACFVETADFHGHKFENDANFELAHFKNRASFYGALFCDDVSFVSAQFGGSHSNFTSAKFKGRHTNFSLAEFRINADFWGADFHSKETKFYRAHFYEAATFNRARVSGQLLFYNAVFESQLFFDSMELGPEAFIDLKLARFKDNVRFIDLKIENGAEFYLGEAIFEKPERVRFHSIRNLRPRWFINIDTRKFDFENTEFYNISGRKAVSRELVTAGILLKWRGGWEDKVAVQSSKNLFSTAIQLLRSSLKFVRKGSSSLKKYWRRIRLVTYSTNKLLSISCRRLAENAETNNRYEEAMNLRYMAMDCHRRSDWWRQYLPITLHWWYWLSSGYGERALRAGVMLFLIWLIPFAFYASPVSRFERKVSDRDVVLSLVLGLENPAAKPDLTDMKGLPTVIDAAFYSLNAMAFQKPEPKPANDSWLTRSVVILQTILGPVQATLLLLAIRRKFMR